MKKIYYLGYYDTPDNKAENRNVFLAATNKMSYIIEALDSQGYSVEVVSAAHTLNPESYDAKTVSIGQNSCLRLFKTLPMGNILKKAISVFYTRHQFKRYVMKNMGPEDTVMVYHSVPYARFIARAKKKLGFRLVLEVEEIYADVSGKSSDRKKEYVAFGAADAYIFPTELLNEKLNTKNKPHTVIYGTYKVEPDRGVRFNDGKTHVIYAGTLDPRKGGIAAVSAAEHLDENYHLHILGFGSDEHKKKLQAEIERISKFAKCTVTYDGLLTGEEYISFLQSCHIGLSTQAPDATFNDTSFPSKILSYMSNGLRVVSIRIPAIERSKIGDAVCFYDKQTSDQIAQSIFKVDIMDDYSGRAIVSQLDVDFKEDLRKLVSL